MQYTYQDIRTALLCLIIANYAGELNVPILLDYGCSLPIMTKHLYNSNEVMHKHLRIWVGHVMIHTRNGDNRVISIAILPYIQQVDIQL